MVGGSGVSASPIAEEVPAATAEPSPTEAPTALLKAGDPVPPAVARLVPSTKRPAKSPSRGATATLSALTMETGGRPPHPASGPTSVRRTSATAVPTRTSTLGPTCRPVASAQSKKDESRALAPARGATGATVVSPQARRGGHPSLSASAPSAPRGRPTGRGGSGTASGSPSRAPCSRHAYRRQTRRKRRIKCPLCGSCTSPATATAGPATLAPFGAASSAVLPTRLFGYFSVFQESHRVVLPGNVRFQTGEGLSRDWCSTDYGSIDHSEAKAMGKRCVRPRPGVLGHFSSNSGSIGAYSARRSCPRAFMATSRRFVFTVRINNTVCWIGAHPQAAQTRSLSDRVLEGSIGMGFEAVFDPDARPRADRQQSCTFIRTL